MPYEKSITKCQCSDYKPLLKRELTLSIRASKTYRLETELGLTLQVLGRDLCPEAGLAVPHLTATTVAWVSTLKDNSREKTPLMKLQRIWQRSKESWISKGQDNKRTCIEELEQLMIKTSEPLVWVRDRRNSTVWRKKRTLRRWFLKQIR